MTSLASLSWAQIFMHSLWKNIAASCLSAPAWNHLEWVSCFQCFGRGMPLVLVLFTHGTFVWYSREHSQRSPRRRHRQHSPEAAGKATSTHILIYSNCFWFLWFLWFSFLFFFNFERIPVSHCNDDILIWCGAQSPAMIFWSQSCFDCLPQRGMRGVADPRCLQPLLLGTPIKCF